MPVPPFCVPAQHDNAGVPWQQVDGRHQLLETSASYQLSFIKHKVSVLCQSGYLTQPSGGLANHPSLVVMNNNGCNSSLAFFNVNARPFDILCNNRINTMLKEKELDPLPEP